MSQGIYTRDQRRAILDRDDWTCQLCGVGLTDHDPTLPTHGIAGHVVAYIEGGPLTLANGRAECARCSARDGARIGNRIRGEKASGTAGVTNGKRSGTTNLGNDQQRDHDQQTESASASTSSASEKRSGTRGPGGGGGADQDHHHDSNKRSISLPDRGRPEGRTFSRLSLDPDQEPGPSHGTGGATTGFATGENADTATDLALPAFSAGPDAFAESPWMKPFLKVPPESCWPRYMSPPHPEAVGSYWREAEQIGRDRGEPALRWWQRLSLARTLEHRADGSLVWPVFLSTASRQSGKSIKLRALCMWRIHQAERIGQQQDISLVSNRIRASDVVQRAVRRWAKVADGWSARDGAGDPSVTKNDDGSCWRMFSCGTIYSSSAGLAIVDEAWDVDPTVVDDALLPTMLERAWPQLGLTSTANPAAGPLFVDRRRELLTGGDDESLIVEWSAPVELDYLDPATWRKASPHWHPNRAELIRRAAGKIGRDDVKLRQFEAEYLNRWAWRVDLAGGHVLQPGDDYLPRGVWAMLAGDEPIVGPLVFGLESMTGQTVTVAAAGVTMSGNVQIEAYRVDDLPTALRWVRAHAGPGSELIVGATLRGDIDEHELGISVQSAATAQNREALVALRGLVHRRAIRHASSAELAQQLDAMTVTQSRATGALRVLDGFDTWDMVRPAAWAATWADRGRRAGSPQVW